MKLSIIVPVYNVEEYVYQCIESLCNQTLQDIEIIVVDDGCKDSSINIVENFKDKRIRIIYQENGGLSSARNNGMKIAKGEYIAFVDSDDYIGINTAYEDMYNIAIKDNSDIVAGNCLWYYSEENNFRMDRNMKAFSSSPMKAEDFFIKCLKTKRTYAPVWLNIYRRQILFDNKLYFKEGVYHEDEHFTPRVLLKSQVVSIYNKDFYIYRQREGSITNNKMNIKNGKDILNICLELDKLVDSISNYELQIEFKKYLFSLAIINIYKYKISNINRDIKKMISRNAVTLPMKIKNMLLYINEDLFLIIENCLRIKNK